LYTLAPRFLPDVLSAQMEEYLPLTGSPLLQMIIFRNWSQNVKISKQSAKVQD
jgi:hypothetical protein